MAANNSPGSRGFYNGALVRYLDFNDAYLAKGETCHPSDNLAAILAGAEHADASGRELMTALAVAYQVQCRLSDVAPVRDKGFDHTTQGSYSVAAGVSKILGLDEVRTADAIGMCGTAFNGLRVTRTGQLSHWKGLAFPNTAACCTRLVFLAMNGITGPLEVFEGNKGFMDAIAGVFDIDWLREDLERVKRTILKRFNAEIHSQSASKAVLDLKARHQFCAADVQRIDDRNLRCGLQDHRWRRRGRQENRESKEQADHSLPFLSRLRCWTAMSCRRNISQKFCGRMCRSYCSESRCDRINRTAPVFRRRCPAASEAALKDGRTSRPRKDRLSRICDPSHAWEGATESSNGLPAPYSDGPGMEEIIGMLPTWKMLRGT